MSKKENIIANLALAGAGLALGVITSICWIAGYGY